MRAALTLLAAVTIGVAAYAVLATFAPVSLAIVGAFWVACGPVAAAMVLGDSWSKKTSGKAEDTTPTVTEVKASSASGAMHHEMSDPRV
jgi:hypothetical protein